MLLTGDYHTHTIYSHGGGVRHGKGTVLQNVQRAKELGLKEIAITDHGFEQMAWGLKRKEFPQLIEDCRAAAQATGLNVYVGMEANLCDENGRTDMLETDYAQFDVFLMGIHRFVKFSTFRDLWNLLIRNSIHMVFKNHVPQSLIRFNTTALIKSIEKNPIDIITHLNFQSFCDVVEVAKAARECGTYIELNSKKVHMTDEELARVCDTGVRFVIDSDAHSPERVGDTKLVEDMLSRVDIPRERIDNIDGRLPHFRFREYKEKHL